VVDYTNCKQFINENIQNATCADVLKDNLHLDPRSQQSCKCRVSFRLDRGFDGKVYLYYGLTNYYQNHRRYVKSRDDNQLLGEFDSTTSDCDPFSDDNGRPIVPCGAIANSLFNDSLTLRSVSHGFVPVLNTGIAWPSDKEIKFRNPPNLKQALEGKARPIAWRKDLWELDLNNSDNNGLQNEDLIVWMRTAALPSFRKLYRRVDHSTANSFKNGLPSGEYVLEIDYSELIHIN
jgi:LEM3 (ligand-effect modulator 3) family / CDC50 family